MRSMEQPTTSQPTRDYPRTPDGKYKYTTWDGRPLHFESTTVPGLVSGPLLAASLRKLFRRKDAPAAR
jgi:hypothetical protein